MKLLTVDFETQCDDAPYTRITEAGAYMVLADKLVDDPQGGDYQYTGSPEVYSQICYELGYPPQTEFIADLTGITDFMLQSQGISRAKMLETLLPLVEAADVIFAHKKAFDQVVFESTCKLYGITPPKKEWICTLTEFQWPKAYTCKKLGHLAFEHGMFDSKIIESGVDRIYMAPLVDRTKLHRAGDDAKLLMQLITMHYKLDDVLAYARTPWVYLKAECLPPWTDGGVQKSIAYKLGFSYEKCRYTEKPNWPKTWVTRVKTMEEVEKIKETVRTSESPFRVAIIEGIK